MNTIICGGRDYHLTDADKAWLDGLKDTLPIAMVFCGGAPGVDRDAYHWAQSRHLPTATFAAAWNELGRAAGPIRNQQMANLAQACIAFPGGRGTADMLAKAKAKGLHIIERAT